MNLSNECLKEALTEKRLDEDLRDFAKMILEHSKIMREVEKIHHEENMNNED